MLQVPIPVSTALNFVALGQWAPFAEISVTLIRLPAGRGATAPRTVVGSYEKERQMSQLLDPRSASNPAA